MKMTRILSFAVAVMLMISCLLMGGCSTPANALEVNGKVYTTGDYLAYVYNVINTDYTTYMYLYYYGADALSEKVTYGEDNEVKLSEYIRLTAQDTMIRQKVLEDMLAEHKIEWDADDLKEIDESLKELKTDAFLPLGFNNDRYINMVKATGLNESSLFHGLYGKGGKREVAEADLRKYFDDNYLSYKIIEFSLVGSDNKDLPEAEVNKIKARLEKYLEEFNKGEKTGAGFDKVYALYTADEEAAKKGSSSSSTGTTTTGSTTTTTTAATTTTAGTTTTTTAGSTNNSTGSTTTEDKKETPTAERNDIVAEKASDEELVKAIRAVQEGSAGIQTYQKNGTTKTMALIFRMDPEAERTETVKDEDGKETTKEVDYYAEEKENVLSYMKYEEFDKEVKEKIAALSDKIVRHKRALNAADVKEMLTLLGM